MVFTLDELNTRLNDPDPNIRKRTQNAIYKRQQRERDRAFQPARQHRLQSLEQENQQQLGRKQNRKLERENRQLLKQHLQLEKQWASESKKRKKEEQKLKRKADRQAATKHRRAQRVEQKRWSREIRDEGYRRRAIYDAKIKIPQHNNQTKEITGWRGTKKSRIRTRARLSNKLARIFDKVKWDEERYDNKLKIYPIKPDGTIVRDGSYDSEALTKATVDYIIENTLDRKRVMLFLVECGPLIIGKIHEHGTTKTRLKVKFRFGRTDPKTGIEETNDSYFSTKFSEGTHIYPTEEDLVMYYEKSLEKIVEHINNYMAKGSVWFIKEVHEMILCVVKHQADYGATWIKLPNGLGKSKSGINIKNDDNECFKWCITRALNPSPRDQQRVTKLLREQTNQYNWTDINFPATISDFKKFESNNKTIALKVYSWVNKTNQPVRLYYSKKIDFKHCVYLLHITEKVGKKHTEYGNRNYDPIGHFVIISKPAVFFSNFGILHDTIDNNQSHHKFWLCEKCAVKFYRESTLIRHQRYCDIDKPTIVYKGGIMEFGNYKKMVRNPIRTYTDFQAFTQPVDNKLGSKTTQTQKHRACSFHTTTVTFDGTISHYTYKGLDAPKKYIEHIEKVAKDFYKKHKNPKPLIITPDIEAEFKSATTCWICKKGFDNEKSNYKVRDHCHYTGNFRGIAHNNCNLKLRESVFVPNIIHNMYGYDIHLFIREMAKNEKDHVKCIAKDDENLISITKDVVVGWTQDLESDKIKPITRKLVFMDSFKFLDSGLDKLVKNLPVEKMVITRSKFQDQKQFDLVTQKGVYPYDYMNSFKRFKETELPPWPCWYNKLTGKHITKDEQQHVKKVWSTFKCKTLEDYHDIYLQSDTTLLADVFEDFIETSFKTRGLDPLHYVTLPGYGWDCMLEQTKVQLDLFEETQDEMCTMFKRGIRGGVSMAVKRYAKANNPYLSDYVPTKPTSYIIYLDENNLYGTPMGDPSPTGSFKWMKDEELENWRSALNRDGVGCILEVDLDYPKHLHDLHQDLPLAPEKQKIGSVFKLMSTLSSKTNYVVHYQLLDLYVKLGLVIKKLHCGIWFKKSAFMKSYVDRNTQSRAKATNDANKNLFKLMTVSVFGKTMENVENRSIVEFANSEEKLLKLSRKPNFKSRKILDENMFMVTMQPMTTNMNKPIYVGQAILDLSKKIMFEFHYNHIKKLYGNKAELLSTDTDSVVYHIQTEDVYEDMKPYIKDLYDTSNYPEDHPLYYTGNKKIPGYMKDECGGKPILEWVALGAKQYAYVYETKDDDGVPQKVYDKKCKGITKSVTANVLNIDEYKKCLWTKEPRSVDVTLIRSRNHTIHTEVTPKVALTFEDTKRYILEDGVHTLPFGHYRLDEDE